MKKMLLIMPLMLLFAACTKDNAIYDTSLSVEPWEADSAALFTPTISDTTASYRTGIMIRNSGRYKYQNLWLFIERTAPDGTTKCDTVEYFLADEFGKWLGKSSIGSLYTITYLYEDTTSFAAGEYSYRIKQAMREESLSGITDIGLRIEKCD